MSRIAHVFSHFLKEETFKEKKLIFSDGRSARENRLTPQETENYSPQSPSVQPKMAAGRQSCRLLQRVAATNAEVLITSLESKFHIQLVKRIFKHMSHLVASRNFCQASVSECVRYTPFSAWIFLAACQALGVWI